MEQDSGHFIKRLIENVHDAVIASDTGFCVREWNHHAEKLYGYRRDEARGRVMGDLMERDYVSQTRTDVVTEFEREGFWEGEVIDHTRDGRSLRIWTRVSKVFDLNGDYIGIVAVNRDVSDEREKQLREDRRNKAYQILAEATVVCSTRAELCRFITDRLATFPDFSGVIAYLAEDVTRGVGPEVYRSAKIPENLAQTLVGDAMLQEQLFGRGAIVLAADVVSSEINALWADVIRDYGFRGLLAVPIRIPGQGVSGAVYLLVSPALKIDSHETHHLENYSYMMASAVNRVTTYEAFVISERRFRSIFDNMLDVFFRIDPSGVLEILSPSAQSLVPDTDIKTLIGRPFQAWLKPNPGEFTAFLEALNRDGAICRYLMRATSPMGVRYVLEITARMTDGIEEKQRHIEGIIRDVTERDRIEEALREKDRLENLAFLVGSVTHSFNNNLTGVLGNISVARHYAVDNARVSGFLEKAEAGCLQARQTVQNLMLITGDIRPQRRLLHPAAVIRSAVATVAGWSETVDFRVDIPDDLPRIKGNEKLLNQVFTHILTNAAEALRESVPDGGQVVQIHAEVVPASPERGIPHAMLSIRFTDNGPGMERETHKRVFEPFFTTRHLSRGLGLSVSRVIVRRHNGSITIESEPGCGTVVTVDLPVSRERTVIMPKDRPLRMLILEPEVPVRSVIVELMQELGHCAVGAESGPEFLSLFRSAADSEAGFDIVLIDMGSYENPSGPGLLSMLRQADPDIHALATTGYPDHPVVNRWRDLGFDGLLMKPFRLDTVEQALNRILPLF